METSLLAKLDPRACAFEQRVDGGGMPELTMELLAGALGSMSENQASMLRVVILNDAAELRKIIRTVHGMIRGFDDDERCKLAHMVVRSVVMPSLCKTCEGHSQYHQGDLIITCPDCGGTGEHVSKGHEIGRAFGIKKSLWISKYDDEFERCRGHVMEWYSTARRVFSDQLQD